MKVRLIIYLFLLLSLPVTTLVNQQATKAGIIGAFKRMAASCKQGDVVYIHYSGHGQQITDVHNDETDWTSAGFRMMPTERLARQMLLLHRS